MVPGEYTLIWAWLKGAATEHQCIHRLPLDVMYVHPRARYGLRQQYLLASQLKSCPGRVSQTQSIQPCSLCVPALILPSQSHLAFQLLVLLLFFLNVFLAVKYAEANSQTFPG